MATLVPGRVAPSPPPPPWRNILRLDAWREVRDDVRATLTQGRGRRLGRRRNICCRASNPRARTILERRSPRARTGAEKGSPAADDERVRQDRWSVFRGKRCDRDYRATLGRMRLQTVISIPEDRSASYIGLECRQDLAVGTHATGKFETTAAKWQLAAATTKPCQMAFW